MCTVSMMMDGWREQFPERWPQILPPTAPASGPIILNPPGVSQADFDKLKAEVEELRKLIMAAKEFDEKTGQPDWHAEEKVAFIKKIAEFVGVDLNDLLK